MKKDPTKPLIKFDPKLYNLSENEREVLDLLIHAAELIAPLYSEQENHQLDGANFYPENITKQQIEDAAKKDPEILSPYTVIEKNGDKLVAIPYHVKYESFLKPIAKKLLEAAALTNNKDFSARLKVQADVLLNGDYDKASVSWMSMKPYVLDITIGPIERYDDKLFFVKTSYQAWVGVMDRDNTKRVNEYKSIILSARKKALMPSEKVDYYDKVQTRVDDAVIFSGLIARTMFVGVNLPNDPLLMEKYGSEITIFKQVNEYRYKNEILPAFEKIFSKSFQKNFSNADIELGSLYSVVLHELAHTYIRYRNSEKNLKDLFPVIDELSASVLGIKVCGSLLLKDVATTKQLESIMLAFMARSFYLVLKESENKSKIHYTIGGAIFINYLLESGAIQQVEGVSWPNFMKMFFSLGELASLLERIISSGSREDAESLINQYGDLKKLQKDFKI